MSLTGITLVVISAVLLITGGALLIVEPLATLAGIAGIFEMVLGMVGILVHALMRARSGKQRLRGQVTGISQS